jgi:hypothetical protein
MYNVGHTAKLGKGKNDVPFFGLFLALHLCKGGLKE